MTFHQARQKLKKLAKGKFHTVEYKVQDGLTATPIQQECTLYIDGLNHYTANTWDKAFEALDRTLNRGPNIIEDANISEIKGGKNDR